MNRLRNYFFTGIIVLLPLIITVYVFLVIFNLLDGLLAELIEALLGFAVPGLGMVLTVIFVLLVGLVATNVIGKRFIALFDRLITRIPMVKVIYGAVKQIISAFATQPRDAFRRVALVEYPRPGIYAIGFVTGEGTGEVQEKTAAKVSSIFIPTTPNPTSGMLLLVPQAEITYLDMSVEEGLKWIISGGVVHPHRLNEERGD